MDDNFIIVKIPTKKHKRKKLIIAVSIIIVLLINIFALHFISKEKNVKNTIIETNDIIIPDTKIRFEGEEEQDDRNFSVENNIEAEVFVTNYGKRYHLSGCRFLAQSKNPISFSEAAEKYSPCSVCKPPE